MNRNRLLPRLVYFIFFIFIVNFLATKFYWYSLLWYFDMPMHFLGGAWLGLAVLWFLSAEEFSLQVVASVLLGVVFVGLAWEVFEFILNKSTTRDSFNVLDTVSDLCFDLAGGLFILLIYFRKTVSWQLNTV